MNKDWQKQQTAENKSTKTSATEWNQTLNYISTVLTIIKEILEILESYSKELDMVKNDKADLKITNEKMQQPKIRAKIRPFCPEYSRGRQKAENTGKGKIQREKRILVQITVHTQCTYLHMIRVSEEVEKE